MIRSCLGHTGNGVLFHRVRSLDGAQRISVDNYTSFGLQVRLSTWKEGTIKIGKHCHFGDYNNITAVEGIVIGDNLLTGSNVLISDKLSSLNIFNFLNKPYKTKSDNIIAGQRSLKL